MSAETTVPNRSVTGRGFVIYDQFTDTYGNKVRVQESSSAEGSRAWIFCEPGDGTGHGSPHLSIEQAKRVRDALDAFIRENEAQPGQVDG